MKSRLTLGIACVFGLCLLASGVHAHHSVESTFDTSKAIVLKGSVDRAIWINPHAYLLINVEGPNGATEPWAVELAPPNSLIRAGFDLRTLRTGGQITVSGFAPKPGVTVNGPAVPPAYEKSELAPLLRALSERKKTNRVIHPQQLTLPDGRTIEATVGGPRWSGQW